MKKLSETEKLANYENAINGLSTEKQFDKMEAVKSPSTIKRFLSKDAPDRLVRRFTYRIAEVMDDSMPIMDRGRILYQLGTFDLAAELLLLAYGEGSKEAAFYLGLIYAKSGRVEDAAEWLHVASEYEKDKGKLVQIISAKAWISELAGNPKRAKQLLEQAGKVGKDDAHFFSGRIKQLDGEYRDAALEFARGIDETGSETCVEELTNCVEKRAFEHMFVYENVRKMMMVQIQRGNTIKYFELGMLDEFEKHDAAAAESYLRAAIIGVPQAVMHLPRFCMKGNRIKLVLAAAEKLFEKNAKKVFGFMIPLLMISRMYGELLDYCNRMFMKGYKESAGQGVNYGMIINGKGIMDAFVEGLQDGKKYCNELSLAVYARTKNRFAADKEFSSDAKAVDESRLN